MRLLIPKKKTLAPGRSLREPYGIALTGSIDNYNNNASPPALAGAALCCPVDASLTLAPPANDAPP
jgi:hypothetical protein